MSALIPITHHIRDGYDVALRNLFDNCTRVEIADFDVLLSG